MTGDASESPAPSAVAGVVSLLTLVAAFGLMALDWPYFWVAFPVGFGGVLPAAVALTKWYVADTRADAGAGAGVGAAETAATERADKEDALDTLRERYARGEIDEAEFERRVERLLETDSIDRAETAYASDRDAASRVRERERERT